MSHEYQDITPSWIAEKWYRGYLRPWELLRIVTWKSVRSAGWLSLAEEALVEDRTGHAMGHLAEWRGKNMVGITNRKIWASWRERGLPPIQLTR